MPSATPPPSSELETDAQESLPTQPETVADESELAAPTMLTTVTEATTEEPLPTAIVDMERVLQDDGTELAQPTVSVELRGSLGEEDPGRFAPIAGDESSDETRVPRSHEVVAETVICVTSATEGAPPVSEEVIQPTVPVLVSVAPEVARTYEPRPELRAPDAPSVITTPPDERRGAVVEGVVWGAVIVLFGLLLGMIVAYARR